MWEEEEEKEAKWVEILYDFKKQAVNELDGFNSSPLNPIGG